MDSVTKNVECIDFEKKLYQAFGQVKDFTLCTSIAKHFYEMGRNNVRQEIIDETEHFTYDRGHDGLL